MLGEMTRQNPVPEIDPLFYIYFASVILCFLAMVPVQYFKHFKELTIENKYPYTLGKYEELPEGIKRTLDQNS